MYLLTQVGITMNILGKCLLLSMIAMIVSLVSEGADRQKYKMQYELCSNCWDNAALESFFSCLKVELIYAQRCDSIEQAKSAIFDYTDKRNCLFQSRAI